MAGASPNLSAAKRFQATMRSNNPGIVPDKAGTARTLEAARRFQQTMRLRDPGIVGNATSELSKALVRSAPAEIATRASGELVKREAGDIARRASGEMVKRPAGELATRAAGEMVKRPAGELATRAGGEMVKRAAGELATRGAGEMVKRGAGDIATRAGGELVKRGAGEMVKQGGRAAVQTAVNQLPAALARSAGSGLAMGVAKTLGPIGAVMAAEKGGEFAPEVRKHQNEEAAVRKYKMAQGMKTGMGNTAQNAYRRGPETHMTGLKGEYKPVEDLTGYAVDLIRKGKDFDEARRLLQGTEKFRGMSDAMKKISLDYYDNWRKDQLAYSNPEARSRLNQYLSSAKRERERTANANKPMTPTDPTGMRKPIRRVLGME